MTMYKTSCCELKSCHAQMQKEYLVLLNFVYSLILDGFPLETNHVVENMHLTGMDDKLIVR